MRILSKLDSIFKAYLTPTKSPCKIVQALKKLCKSPLYQGTNKKVPHVTCQMPHVTPVAVIGPQANFAKNIWIYDRYFHYISFAKLHEKANYSQQVIFSLYDVIYTFKKTLNKDKCQNFINWLYYSLNHYIYRSSGNLARLSALLYAGFCNYFYSYSF